MNAAIHTSSHPKTAVPSAGRPRAAVLLSTYNGEAYLREQLDSILSQTWDNLSLIIRDDGSSDNTVSILEEYGAEYPQITLIPSRENLGYPACFYALTDLPIDADYFFFSDQDDVWLPDKVERAIRRMEEEAAGHSDGENPPVLAYFAGYHICDEQLKILSRSPKVTGPFCLRTALFEVCGLEFTMAINRPAMELLNRNKPRRAKARGTWMSMLYSAFGTVLYDNEPCALYRRHTSAVTSKDQKGIGFWIWRIKEFFFGGFDEYKEILQDFYDVTAGQLSLSDRRMLYLFARQSYLGGVAVKVLYPRRLRRRWADELALRGVFLLGRL